MDDPLTVDYYVQWSRDALSIAEKTSGSSFQLAFFERLAREIVKKATVTLTAERDALKWMLDDWEKSAARAAVEACGNKKHCTCVPLLRKEVSRLKAIVRENTA